MTNETAPHPSNPLAWYFLSTGSFAFLQKVSAVLIHPFALPNRFSHRCLEASSTGFFFHLCCLSKAKTYSMATYPNSYTLLSRTFCPGVPAQTKQKSLQSATICYHTQQHHFFTFSNSHIIESTLAKDTQNPGLSRGGRRRVQIALHVQSEVFSNHSTCTRAKDRVCRSSPGAHKRQSYTVSTHRQVLINSVQLLFRVYLVEHALRFQSLTPSAVNQALLLPPFPDAPATTTT